MSQGRLLPARQQRRRPWISCAVALLAMLVVSPGGYAATPSYTLKSWSQADGLPGARVWAVSQDDDGYIWIGTDVGLVRFDGVEFVDWQRLSDVPLPRREVTALCIDREGSLWVGFGIHGGVARIRDGRVALFGELEGLAQGFVTFIAEDGAGTIWAGGLSGLHVFDGSRWERVSTLSGLPEGPSLEAYQDDDGNLWVAYASGLFKRTGRLEFRQDPSPAVFQTTLAQSVFDASNQAAASASRFSFLRDRQERTWLATRGQGLWIAGLGDGVESPVVRRVTARNGLSSDVVQAIFEDRDGDVWVGTQSGLHQFSTRSVTPLIDLGVVRALEETRDGSLWAGTYEGVVRISGNHERRFGPDEGGPDATVTALHGDARGGLWVATLETVSKFLDGRWSPVPLPQTPGLSWISDLTSDARGNLWICDMYQGVFRWSGGKLTAFEGLPAELRSAVYTIYGDTGGQIWIGFTNGNLGVIRQDGMFYLHDSIGGLAGTVTALYQDRDDALWIGASDGLSRLKDGRFTTVTQDRNGLPVDTVTTVVEDELGQVWVGASSGIIRLAPGQFDSVEKDPNHQVEYRLYDNSDGLDSMPVRIGNPASARASDGKLWFVTGAGAAVLDPEQIRGASTPPKVLIEDVQVDGRRVSLQGPLSLPSSHTRVQILYTALTYASPTRTQYRYRLQGFDADWIDAETRREAIYTNLPASDYRFQVIARSNQGTWNRQGAVLEFSIPPPFYQTGWFYLVVTVMVTLAAWGAWKFRMFQVNRRFSLVLAERARLSREIHDTLLQSLVGVALQFDVLAGSLETTPESAGRTLRRIRKDVEEYIREARESIWNLRSRPDFRSLAMTLRETCEQLARSTSSRVEFEARGDSCPCPTVTEEQLVRICREAITNAIRHAQADQIRVSLHYSQDSIRLQVTDNGHGFDISRSSDDVVGHLGLTSMRERAEAIGGEFTISSTREHGTDIQVVVPVAK